MTEEGKITLRCGIRVNVFVFIGITLRLQRTDHNAALAVNRHPDALLAVRTPHGERHFAPPAKNRMSEDHPPTHRTVPY